MAAEALLFYNEENWIPFDVPLDYTASLPPDQRYEPPPPPPDVTSHPVPQDSADDDLDNPGTPAATKKVVF